MWYMENFQLIEYIQNQQTSGVPKEVIVHSLLDKGWKIVAIENAIAATAVKEITLSSQNISIGTRYKIYRLTLWMFVIWYVFQTLTSVTASVLPPSLWNVFMLVSLLLGFATIVLIILICIGSGYSHQGRIVKAARLAFRLTSVLFVIATLINVYLITTTGVSLAYFYLPLLIPVLGILGIILLILDRIPESK